MNRQTNAEVDAALNQALAMIQRNKIEEVESICAQVLSQRPNHAKAMQIWGMAAYVGGKREVALERLTQAATLDPNVGHARAQLAELLRQFGRLDDALPHIQAAVRLMPQVAEFHLTLGNVLRDRGDADGAIAAYQQAAKISPTLNNIWWNLAEMYLRRQDFSNALAAYQRAMPADAHPADPYITMAHAARLRGLLSAAEKAYRQALELKPGDFECEAALGNILRQSSRVAEAIEHYRAAIKRSGHPAIQSNLLLACTGNDRMTPEQVFEEHRQWGANVQQIVGPVAPHIVDSAPGRKLRVGYVSPDFRDHAVWKWLEPILAHHDRQRSEIIGYSVTAKPDAVTEAIRKQCDHFRDIAPVSDEDAAELIRADRVDILIDLAGHTGENRLMIFARKPAPIQVTYLGYPNTTGLSRMDYLITDAHIDPPGRTERFHTEQLYRLPHCFACYRPPSGAPEPAPPPSQDLGWRRGTGFINFGSFNSFSKLSPTLLDIWAKILTRVGDAHLLLKSSTVIDPGVVQLVRRDLENRSISPRRVHVSPPHPTQASHLAAYANVDIALDTYPYHGTTTTCDALLMGVPVVTLEGPTHPSRVGVSLLRNIGVAELIASSPDEYIEIAVRLATDPQRLASLRRELRGKLLASRLVDGPAFTRELEAAFAEMWRRRA